MLSFPKSTEVNKLMPKEIFVKNLSLSPALKGKLTTDVKKIIWKYKLSPTTINIEAGAEVPEILILYIELKKQDADDRLFESIAKQNSHKIIFLFLYENRGQLAVFYDKLYKTSWQEMSVLSLSVQGLNLDKIWQQFVVQISGIIPEQNRTLKEQIEIEEKRRKLLKEIERLEKLARSEKQPKKKFELVQQLHVIEKTLEG